MHVYTLDLPKHKVKKYNIRDLDKISAIVVHHSGVNPKKDTLEYSKVHIKAIARYHIMHNDWPGIGYHYVIDKQGRIFLTNQPSTVSYHCHNHNTHTLGFCLLGAYHKEEDPPQDQLISLAWLIQNYHAAIPMINVVMPHKMYNQTACPGHWKRWDVSIFGQLQ
jgi:hypothetical protein